MTNHIYEIYNIFYIITHISYITTLSFYLVLEDEFINRYYTMFLFIPVLINYTLTYIKKYIKTSLVINFIYIQAKLIFMINYFIYQDDFTHINKEHHIIYSIFLYIIYIIEVISMVYFYFFVLVLHYNNIDFTNYSTIQ